MPNVPPGLVRVFYMPSQYWLCCVVACSLLASFLRLGVDRCTTELILQKINAFLVESNVEATVHVPMAMIFDIFSVKMDVFVVGFWILSFICAVLYLYTRSAVTTPQDANFKSFQRTYLCVYLLAMAGDWLQGPYVYALYQHYGMEAHDIEVLFVAGFGSSMIFGTVIGSFADRYGRRANCILYGIAYGLACVTKHFNNFWILMVGRLLGGIATSILYSAFESWLVYEHNKRGFDPDLLGTIFSHAVLGNSLVAISSGLVAQKFADFFGFVAPFDVSMTLMVIMIIVVMFTWVENYGDQSSNTFQSIKGATAAIATDHKILCLGLIQSLFEGSMFMFVLEWTPALANPEPVEEVGGKRALLEDTSERKTIPHGFIFAGFMVAIMVGSSLFKLLSKNHSPESFMRGVLFVAACTLIVPVLYPGNQVLIFIGFLVFEVCVGIFWPSLSTMRGKYVPEATRATIMNIFRVPLNLIVVVILTQNLPMHVIFECCVVFLVIATLCQQWLLSSVLRMHKNSVTNSSSQPTTPTQREVDSADKKPLMDIEA